MPCHDLCIVFLFWRSSPKSHLSPAFNRHNGHVPFLRAFSQVDYVLSTCRQVVNLPRQLYHARGQVGGRWYWLRRLSDGLNKVRRRCGRDGVGVYVHFTQYF